MRRVVIPELLDEDLGTPEEIAASLADLRRLNRWFGGTRTTVDLVRRVARQTGRSEFSVLDIGAGCGGMIASVRDALSQGGLQIQATLLDRKPSHMALADNHMHRVAANALALPFRDSAFDLVSCALFTHHLEPGDVITFLREALRVSRTALLINDLRRSATSLALVYAGFALMRSSMSRHDGVASVRRAYTIGEMRVMIARAGIAKAETRRYYLFRMGAIIWKS
ncbi:MAG TPA: methyltransferase domain-containing protein [Armatimonadota bacterium]|nr:methyltransferase domain-containing protein [Armatimonadota bacterium]